MRCPVWMRLRVVWLVRLRRPGAMARRWSRRPLMAWRGAVGGSGALEVGQGCRRFFRSGSWPVCGSPPACGDGLPQGVGEPLRQVLSQAWVVDPVVLDEALVDAPGGLDRSVTIIGEEVLRALGLGVGEQAGPGA